MSSPISPPDPPLADDVLVFTVPGERDIDAIVEACNDPDIPRWTTVPSPYAAADARTFLDQVARDWNDGVAATFVFSRHGSDRLDGMISTSFVTKTIGVVGYWTAPWARGAGLATRALTLIGDWCFANVNLERIDLATLPGNRASERVAQKAGYTGGRIVKHGFVHNGTRRDVRLWSLAPPA